MVRVLPGAYVSINDMSQLPEGQTALTVGCVLDANRGPVNELTLVTSPTDFLTKFTFSGKPSIQDDNTYHSILKILAKTNQMYVSRAANNPLYGGIVIKKQVELGKVLSATKVDGETKAYIMVAGDVTSKVAAGDMIMVSGTTKAETTTKQANIDGYYKVASVTAQVFTGQEDPNRTKIELTGAIADAFTAAENTKAKAFMASGVGINYTKIATIASAVSATKAFTITGDVTAKFALGNKFTVKNSTTTANNKDFTVEDNEEADPISYDAETGLTTIKVKETVVAGNDGDMYYDSIATPDNFAFDNSNDLLLITGNNPGAYNGDLKFDIISSVDNHDDLVYYKGAVIGGQTCTFDTMQLTVKNGNTGDTLETYLFSRDPEAKTIDGQNLFVDQVVEGSAYIKVINNEDADKGLMPSSSLSDVSLSATGGDNGGDVTAAVLTAALEPFNDKTVSISLLANGCSTPAETQEFQQALMSVADTRKDLMVFLNNPVSTENKTLNSDKAQAIVDYKKEDLANTSFYGCMYSPHVKVSDTFNNRTIKIGSDAIAIAGWLDVINNLNYPYAYAGPKNGLVQGVTCDWKIGDMSGEAQILNDASVNYVAYDGKVGRYYMQAQNTLQVANSSMRNIGTVLNVLDIKEHFVTLLKEYLQLPITDDLRREIKDISNDYLSPMLGVRFSNYSFQDVTTDIDLADNTLRYLLTIAPTPYAQKIYLVMNIVNATFDFSIVQSL